MRDPERIIYRDVGKGQKIVVIHHKPSGYEVEKPYPAGDDDAEEQAKAAARAELAERLAGWVQPDPEPERKLSKAQRQQIVTDALSRIGVPVPHIPVIAKNLEDVLDDGWWAMVYADGGLAGCRNAVATIARENIEAANAGKPAPRQIVR